MNMNTEQTVTTAQMNQWSYSIDTENLTLSGSNRMTAKAGPKAGEEIEAFYTLSANSKDRYGAPIFFQEPDLRIDVKVTIPLKEGSSYAKGDDGSFQGEILDKGVVGYIIRDAESGDVVDRGSFSKLACFTGQDYLVDPETHQLMIDGKYYDLISYIETDKNRQDGVVGVYEAAKSKSDVVREVPPLSMELEEFARFIPSSLRELQEKLDG